MIVSVNGGFMLYPAPSVLEMQGICAQMCSPTVEVHPIGLRIGQRQWQRWCQEWPFLIGVPNVDLFGQYVLVCGLEDWFEWIFGPTEDDATHGD